MLAVKKNDPAFLLYSKDWLQGTAQMTSEEKGVYIDLLCHQHQEMGSLPVNTKRLARMAHLPEEDFLKIWEFLKEKFIEKGGKLFNKKLDLVMNGRSDFAQMKKIIGTFGRQLTVMELSGEQRNILKKIFKYQDFIQESEQNEQNLSKTISKWISNWLANYSPTPIGNVENENSFFNKKEDKRKGGMGEKEKGEGEIFNNMPLPENVSELPAVKIQAAIEQMKITQQTNIDEKQVIGMWAIFKTQKLTGKKFFSDVEAIHDYFLNWIKTQKFSNGTKSDSAGSKPLTRAEQQQAGIAKLVEKGNRDFAKLFGEENS